MRKFAKCIGSEGKSQGNREGKCPRHAAIDHRCEAFGFSHGDV